METQVIKYDITDAAIAEMKNRYMGLVITDLENKEEFDAVHSARMVVKGKRVEVDKKRKELKADALIWSKKVQDEANRIFALIEPIETHLKKEENKVEAGQKRKEGARIAAIKERIREFPMLLNNLKGYGTVDELKAVIAKLESIEIEPDHFFEFTAEATQVHAETFNAACQALENRERMDKEDAERKVETERLAVERKKQEEAEANLREAAAKIRAEQEEKDAAIQAEQDKIDADKRKIAEEKAELEKAKKADQERRDREKFERQAKIQAEINAKEKAEREEIERKEAEAAGHERQETFKIELIEEGDELRQVMKVYHKDMLIAEHWDGGEPEDNLFLRDWYWVPDIIETAYKLGFKDGQRAKK